MSKRSLEQFPRNSQVHWKDALELLAAIESTSNQQDWIMVSDYFMPSLTETDQIWNSTTVASSSKIISGKHGILSKLLLSHQDACRLLTNDCLDLDSFIQEIKEFKSNQQIQDKWISLENEDECLELTKELNLYKIPQVAVRPTLFTKSHARVGLMGNPSDGFYGRTISFLLSNFWVELRLKPHYNPSDESVKLSLNDITDPWRFSSLSTCHQVCQKDGYYGMHRLFLATIKVFKQYCHSKDINLLKTPGFTVSYETNIPRQVGLSGSSAFVTGLLRLLMKYYDIEDVVLKWEQANLALAAEQEELGISAGHQDRVIQTFGGCLFMDFDKSLMTSRGYGAYVPIDTNLLPVGLWIGRIIE